MKVLDLRCALDHGFEGWFASEEDFLAQQATRQVQCPMCGSNEVRKAPSAPRLNLRTTADEPLATMAAAAKSETRPVASGASSAVQRMRVLQAAWLKAARQVMAQTEDVGERFAAEARRIHHGEAPERAIRGQATAGEAAELLDEGIAVLPLLLPDAAKSPLQ